MESYSVQAVLSAVDKNFSKAFEAANKAVNSFSNNTTKSTGTGGNSMIKFGVVTGTAMAVVSKALSAVTNHIGNAVDRFDTLNKYPVVMKALGYSTRDTGKSMKLLSNGIDGLPTSLNEITSAAQQFAPLTGSATSGAKAALALNDAFLASGASVADTSRGMQQYTQMLATGKVDMQSWRTLQETMPIALRKTANAFGFTGKSAEQDLFNALKSGKITVDDLNKKFVELDKGQNGFATLARKNSVGIKTSFTNLGTAVTKGLADTLSAINTGLKNAKLGGIADIINNMKDGIKATFNAINSVIAAAVPIIVNSIKTMVNFVSANKNWLLPLAAGVAGFITAFMAINKVITIISTIKMAFTGLFAVLSANPFVLITAAIIGVVAALVYFLTQTKTGQQIVTTVVAAIQAAWQTFATFMSTLWTGIVTVATAAWNLLVTLMTPVITAIMAIWQSLSAYFSALWTSIITVATATWNLLVTIFTPIIAAIMAAWQVLSPFFAGLFQGIVTIISTVVSVIQTIWTTAWNVISTVVTAAWSVITSIVSGALNVIAGIINAVTAAIQGNWSGAWSAIQGVASTIWSTIQSVVTTGINAVKSVITSVMNAIESVTSSVWNSIKSLTSSIWNGIKSVISSVINAIMSVVTSVWNGIKSVTSSAWNGIKSAISSGINAARSVVSSAVNAMRSSAISAWNAMKSAANSVVSGIKSAFHSLASINLGAAGRAIMNSFLGGLTAAWGKVKNFVSGIAGWIKDHKGPISYDRKLLIPAGAAIMNGLNSGLIDNFKTVQKNVKNMGSVISDSMNSKFQLTDVFGSINTSLNNSSLNGVMEHELSVANDWTVEVPVNLDGQEVARITAKPMQQELNRINTQNNRIHGQR